MEKVIQYSKLVLFADDGLLYISGNNLNLIKDNIEKDLSAIYTWLNMNKLVLNTNKTKFMILNNPSPELQFNIQINNTIIEQITSIKYLGIVLDNKLSFNEHIDHICKKVSKKLGVLRRTRKNISKNSAIKVFNVTVKPHFEYCASLLYLCNITQKTRLQKLQNKAMRTILKCDRYSSITSMLESLNWLNINQRLYMMAMVFVFKIKHNLCPEYLQSSVPTRRVIPYNLRNVEEFNIIRTRTSRAQASILYMGLQAFNYLPINIRNIENLNQFKNQVFIYAKTYIN